MTKTVLDKAYIGDQFIKCLATDKKCFSFTNGKNNFLACNCCSKFGCQIDSVKVFFSKLNNIFWSQKRPPKSVSAVNKNLDEKNSFAIYEGKQLAIFLEIYCTFLSKHKPLYEFAVPEGEETITISLCLPSTVRIFGLPTKSFQIVQQQHTKDSKKIGLSMLKYFCKNFTCKKDMKPFYHLFRQWFPQPVVPISTMNSQAVNIVKALKGKIMPLNDEVLAAVKHILMKHCPDLNKLKRVSNGGENIVFAPPKGIKAWNGMKTNKKVQALHNVLEEGIQDLWMDCPEAMEFFEYKMSCLFSRLTAENPKGIPQTAHTDYTSEQIGETFDALKVNPLIAFTPMHEDGTMLLIWTDKYKRWQILAENQPAKYYLYIPFGTLLILPGHVVHSGGFCFGNVFGNENIPKRLWNFKNHRLHFFLCPDAASIDQANSDANEIIYDDEDKEEIQPHGKRKHDDSDESQRKSDHADYIVEDVNYEKVHHNLLSTFVEEEQVNSKNNKGKAKARKN